MIRFKKSILVILMFVFLVFPVFSLAETDYEKGEGWVYQNGTLTITENDGLKDFVSNDQDEQTGEWKYDHSVWDVKMFVIGKSVTELKNEIYEWNQLEPQETMIESGNTCFVIDHGWVVNTKTKSLFGAADVPAMKVRTKIDDLPNYIEHIGEGAFYDYRELASIFIPTKVVSIGDRSFMFCKSLSLLNTPEKLQTIGSQAFEGCDLLNHISLNQGVTDIGDSAFSSCIGMETTDIRNTSINSIRSDLFGACYKIQFMELPDSVCRIEPLAFRICYNLSLLVIHADNIIVLDDAFYGCDCLDRIVFSKGTPEFLGKTLFGETDKSPDGRGYISNSSENRGEIIPYPTLYYTAAYASEWAPNGETEWNGYPIQQISQEELEALLAEARGEAAPESVTLSPAPTQPPTLEPASTSQPDIASADPAALDAWMLAAAVTAVVAVGVIVFSLVRKKKNK